MKYSEIQVGETYTYNLYTSGQLEVEVLSVWGRFVYVRYVVYGVGMSGVGQFIEKKRWKPAWRLK